MNTFAMIGGKIGEGEAELLRAIDVGQTRQADLFRTRSRRASTMTELPIACSLTPDALQARRAGLSWDLVHRAEGHEDLSEGLRLRFPPTSETLDAVIQAVEAERHCCRFLRFGITIGPDGGPVFLQLTGPSGTREFIGALFDV